MWGAPGPLLPRTPSARAAGSAKGPDLPSPPQQLPPGQGAGLPRGGGGPLALASVPIPSSCFCSVPPTAPSPPGATVLLVGGSLQPWEELLVPQSRL